MRTILFITTGVVLLTFAGCVSSEGPGRTDWRLDASPGQTDVASQRFSSAETQGPTAVESAIALSDKYAKLSEETSMLRQQKQNLDVENQQLKEQSQSCRSQLEQAQKELGEVNDLLVEMRVELNNWKQDVLGFRDEMRDAEKAQLEALLKILKLLGAETNQPGNMQTRVSEEQK
jgi:chromosome segregation ATPase